MKFIHRLFVNFEILSIDFSIILYQIFPEKTTLVKQQITSLPRKCTLIYHSGGICVLRGFLEKAIIRFFKLSRQQASPVYRHSPFFVNYAFCNFVDSKHSICLYTALFSPKIVSADKRKNLLGCGSPAETSAKQKHRPRRQPRQPQTP